MKIYIPDQLINDLAFFNGVKLILLKNDNIIFRHDIKKAHLTYCKTSGLDHFQLPDDLFSDCDEIHFVISYEAGDVKLKYLNKTELTKKPFKGKAPILKKNKDILYDDINHDKELIMSLIDEQFLLNELESDTPVGHRNLIYFSIARNPDYVGLLEIAINSIINTTKTKNFEFLIITSEEYKPLLEASEIIQKVKPYYLIVPDPTDGVEASINKLKVFEFENIDLYKNILFLDCDIVCTGDVFKLLNNHTIQKNELLVVSNPTVPINSHESVFHGLDFDDPERIARIYENKQMPFNAGQFMFKNSVRMRKHFETVLWFTQSWPGRYFFEQCFMNRYFCGFNMTDNKTLAPHFELLSVLKNTPDRKVHSDNTIFIHFIAPPLDPITKLTFIREYANAHQLKI